MAQLKSTYITGNLSVTGNILASKIALHDGTNGYILMADGSTMAVGDLANDNELAALQTQLNNVVGDAEDTSTDATLYGAIAYAKSAYDLANGKTTMSAVEDKDYATKTQAKGYANAVLGESDDAATKNTVYGAKAAASAAQTTANNILGTSTDTSDKTTLYGAIALANSKTTMAAVKQQGYATTTEAKGYADAKDAAITTAQTTASSAATAAATAKTTAEGKVSKTGDDTMSGNLTFYNSNGIKFGTGTNANTPNVKATYKYNSSTDCVELSFT